MDVNGSVTAIGAIYTTKGGADICSSKGTGKYIQQGVPGTETITHQYTQKKSDVTNHDIPITAAKLHNADGNYTETNKTVASAGDTFSYCTCPRCGGKWGKNLKVAAIVDGDGNEGTPLDTLKKAVEDLATDQYIKMLHNTAETITADKDLYLDLNGCTVTGDFTMSNKCILHGMDSTTDTYDGTNAGKIVGKVSLSDKTTYQTGKEGDDTYKRYVAIPGEENGKPTVSFHRFNISVSGYRFELAAPQCALFFIGKFQGDEAAKSHLTSLKFTLTDENKAQLGTVSYLIPNDKGKIPKMPAEGEESTSEVVHDDDGAYFFEAYLMRNIDKNTPATYQTKFIATAQATFDNGGKQSDPQELSFLDAWTDPNMKITDKQQEILKNFLAGLDTTNQTE